jgi:C4-dicarboxylate-specific signal transduction histidine kinase
MKSASTLSSIKNVSPASLGANFYKRGFAARWVAPIVPALSLLAILGTTAAILQALFWHEGALQRNQLMRDVQTIEVNLTRELLADQQFVDRLAFELAERKDANAYFALQAEEYIRLRPAIANISWNSASNTTRLYAPQSRAYADILSERPAMEELGRITRLTEATERGTYTNVYRDYQQHNYLEYHTPVAQNQKFLGTISVTYPLQRVAQLFVPVSFANRYSVDIVESEVANKRELAANAGDNLSQSVAVTLPWRDVRLVATSLKTESSLTPKILAALTLAMAAFITWSLWALRKHVKRRDEADRALVASHERFETVTEALDAAVYVADLKSNEILFANETCRQFFSGASSSAGAGADVASIESGFDDAPSKIFAASTLIDADGKHLGVQKDEFFHRASNRWYLLRAKCIQWVDGRTARMHMASDITDRKRSDETNRQQQEKLLLTSRLLTVGEMASTLAHEINQPLAAIASYNQGCVRRLRSGSWDAEEIAATLEKASAQAERAGQVIQRVREFLRNREPTRTAHDVNDVMSGVAKLVELEAEQAQVELKLKLHADLRPVLMDRIMVEQVVLNLVKNAIEAMKNTDQISRSLTMTTLPSTGDVVEVSVTDQGHGITAESEAELFKPFFTTKPEGMGIGLNICRSIVELHEGRLWFSRNVGAGSTFRFTLPVAV